MQGSEQRYPYPRRECGPCLSSPVRLRPCCKGSPSVTQNKTVLPLHPGRLSTTPSAPLVDSPHHHTHIGAVLLTSRTLRRRAVSVRSFFSRSFFNSGCTGFTLRARSSITSRTQHPATTVYDYCHSPSLHPNLAPPRILYAPRLRPCNLRADRCLSLVLILGRLVPRQRLFRLTAAVPSTRSRRATLISQCPHHG